MRWFENHDVGEFGADEGHVVRDTVPLEVMRHLTRFAKLQVGERTARHVTGSHDMEHRLGAVLYGDLTRGHDLGHRVLRSDLANNVAKKNGRQIASRVARRELGEALHRLGPELRELR